MAAEGDYVLPDTHSADQQASPGQMFLQRTPAATRREPRTLLRGIAYRHTGNRTTGGKNVK